ncbi:hypothetical protein H6P81_000327 [Aristolochia fimbriata]|uniref:Protein FAM33A n=1 Tax=Aristolochia fimbriata TaxID=158543 RepID=A0AAV7F4I9_ARIFI|nr:hypothetical protein H6P81_000327 [Aristolochia fimbriata]
MAAPGVDGVVQLLTKANHDLNLVQHCLEKEFNQVYPENVNPLKLVSRISRIQADLLLLKEQSRTLLAAKQDLIDKARTNLVRNRSLLHRLQASSGISLVSDSEDSAYRNFSQAIDEWTSQVRSKTGNENPASAEDINQLLFSAIVKD